MRKSHLLSLTLFLLGVLFTSIAVTSGEMKGGFFIIFPYMIGSGIYAFIGIILIFLAFIFFTFGFLEVFEEIGELKESEAEMVSREKVEGGGILLIGPFPIIFGTSSRSVFILVVLTALIMVLAIIILLFDLLPKI